MRSRSCQAITIVGAALVASLPLFAASQPDNAAACRAGNGPKLGVVLVFFDQMRGDYLEKWKSLFVAGGFKRLQSEGATFVDCHYPYANTVTAAGHASLLTGCPPHEHGIVGNAWFDRRTGKTVQSITGLFGPDPLRRKSPTVGDVLLERTKGKAKVVSLSIKGSSGDPDGGALHAQDRLLAVVGGSVRHRPATTPTSRRSWVTEFNNAGKLKAYCGKPWRSICWRSSITNRSAGPHNFKYEGTGSGQGRVFPHPTPTTAAVRCSPYGNEVLLDLVKTAIEKEPLLNRRRARSSLRQLLVQRHRRPQLRARLAGSPRHDAPVRPHRPRPARFSRCTDRQGRILRHAIRRPRHLSAAGSRQAARQGRRPCAERAARQAIAGVPAREVRRGQAEDQVDRSEPGSLDLSRPVGARGGGTCVGRRRTSSCRLARSAAGHRTSLHPGGSVVCAAALRSNRRGSPTIVRSGPQRRRDGGPQAVLLARRQHRHRHDARLAASVRHACAVARDGPRHRAGHSARACVVVGAGADPGAWPRHRRAGVGVMSGAGAGCSGTAVR